MSAKFYVFIFAVMLAFFIAAPQGARGEEKIDSCWYLQRHMPSNGYYNPDTTYIDTCFQYTPDNPGKRRHIAIRGFEFVTSVRLIDLPKMPRDTIYEFSWLDIDTNLIELLQQFQEMENKFGTFAIRKKYPEDIDTSYGTSRVYLIRFNNYQIVDTVLKIFEGLDKLIYTSFDGVPYYEPSGDIDNFDNNRQLIIQFYPNPITSNELHIINISNEFRENEVLLIIDILGNIIKKIIINKPCYDILLNDLPIISGKYFVLYKNKAYPFIIEK